jgi:hypothetical protein
MLRQFTRQLHSLSIDRRRCVSRPLVKAKLQQAFMLLSGHHNDTGKSKSEQQTEQEHSTLFSIAPFCAPTGNIFRSFA